MKDEPFRELTERDFERARIGKRFWKVSLDQIPGEPKHKGMTQKYVDGLSKAVEQGWGLMFWGDYDTGKTSLLDILLMEVMKRGGTALLMRADEVVAALYDDTPFDSDFNLFERAAFVDLLSMDDLGAEPDRTGSALAIERLIRLRYDHQKATSLSTNLPLKDFQARYPAIFAVLKGCVCPVRVQGPGWRDGDQDRLRDGLGLED